jgi:hypothetical protein
VAVHCSYCTPDYGYGKYPKHVEWSCNKIKILVLHLVGYFMCIYNNYYFSITDNITNNNNPINNTNGDLNKINPLNYLYSVFEQ